MGHVVESMKGKRLKHKKPIEGDGSDSGARSKSMTGLDQFYTRPDLAQHYISHVLGRWSDSNVLFIEPSAGSGAFLEPLLNAGKTVKAYDIEPRAFGINRANYLEIKNVREGGHSAIVVVGNPPFGKNACAAVKFFNKAAASADEIAFIVPRTFRKISLQKRLRAKFHLMHDADVEKNAFIRDGVPYDVPCAWQIWAKKESDRNIPDTPSVDHLIGYTTPMEASFAMRRVGFYAGRVITNNILALSETTHYFMRELTRGVLDVLRGIDWTELTSQTAGVRSLSKVEIAFKLDEAYHA